MRDTYYIFPLLDKEHPIVILINNNINSICIDLANAILLDRLVPFNIPIVNIINIIVIII